MGVEELPKVCSPLDPEPGQGDILSVIPFDPNATQIFHKSITRTKVTPELKQPTG